MKEKKLTFVYVPSSNDTWIKYIFLDQIKVKTHFTKYETRHLLVAYVPRLTAHDVFILIDSHEVEIHLGSWQWLEKYGWRTFFKISHFIQYCLEFISLQSLENLNINLII